MDSSFTSFLSSMTQKFLSAVKMYFRSFPSFEEIPTYIVRINTTVYIHYPDLLALPTSRLCVGSEYKVIQGMLMIFSKDVLLTLLHDPCIYDKQATCSPQNDDTFLDKIVRSYAVRPKSA